MIPNKCRAQSLLLPVVKHTRINIHRTEKGRRRRDWTALKVSNKPIDKFPPPSLRFGKMNMNASIRLEGGNLSYGLLLITVDV